MKAALEAYLDIETTGLSARDCEITVVGIFLCRGDDSRMVQIVGTDITADAVIETVRPADIVYTYNGSRFDLPFIQRRLGLRVTDLVRHRDLMYDCWRHNLRGGLKAVERQLAIARRLTDINGFDAVRLWWRYIDYSDLNALSTLLEYNREDVVNLRTLRERLDRIPPAGSGS